VSEVCPFDPHLIVISPRESGHPQRETLRILLYQRQRCPGGQTARRAFKCLVSYHRADPAVQWDGDRDTRGPTDFGGEKQQHPGLLVPSAGQETYDEDDGDGDGDGESGDDVKEIKRPSGAGKKNSSPKDRRSNNSEEVRVLATVNMKASSCARTS
jgi:hypothetical protein